MIRIQQNVLDLDRLGSGPPGHCFLRIRMILELISRGDLKTLEIIVWSPLLADHYALDQQVQFNCCYDAKAGFLLLS
jgi:hypothetical protein